ncbi:hypothetical protein TSMEX_005148 [Taenia solium]|eukprot:TsM_000944100 transcript=TsM_000944100 gene=TsM_000944100
MLLLVAVRLEADSDREKRVFMRAQCKAKCLQYFGHSDDAAIKRLPLMPPPPPQPLLLRLANKYQQ